MASTYVATNAVITHVIKAETMKRTYEQTTLRIV